MMEATAAVTFPVARSLHCSAETATTMLMGVALLKMVVPIRGVTADPAWVTPTKTGEDPSSDLMVRGRAVKREMTSEDLVLVSWEDPKTLVEDLEKETRMI